MLLLNTVSCLQSTVRFYPDTVRCYPDTVRYYPDPVRYYPDPVRCYPDPVRCYPDPVKCYPDPVRYYPDPVRDYPDLVRDYPDLVRDYPEPKMDFPELFALNLRLRTSNFLKNCTNIFIVLDMAMIFFKLFFYDVFFGWFFNPNPDIACRDNNRAGNNWIIVLFFADWEICQILKILQIHGI